ncbi:MAG TPA: ABC transporter substrate-binding protein [Methylomirabilota bacterium]|jgi:putative ABC transport system substrate-binding protein|nr:ABC transporter substrate-binding protein [Methylomirabilota bacterium]
MQRRRFVIGGLASAVNLIAAEAAKVHRVGILWPGRKPSTSPYFDDFRQSLRDAGYAEGTNLAFSPLWAEDRNERLRDLAAELIRLNVDLLFSAYTPVIRALANATATVPIVALMVGDPVDDGLIASLARPGGNITGLTGRATELSEKLLALLKESRPGASRIAVLGTARAVAFYRARMEAAARSMEIRLQFLEVASPAELDTLFDKAAKARAEGLVLLPGPMVVTNQTRLAKLALERQFPAIFWRMDFPEAGGFMAYGPDLADLWRRGGGMVAKILKGAKPSDLPVERSDRFRLVINLQTAKALGLTTPPALLMRADKVIE